MTQFDDVSSTNGWNDFVKASQFVASLRESVAEVLQGIPADKLTDLKTIEKALQYRFRASHLEQRFSTCGTLTPRGTRRTGWGYAKSKSVMADSRNIKD
ncbi:hypothetical protein AVEN_64837-1 [Araneus ventricosus]|uniref:Uncharacterized protein n=1 Tax=Araneus ventricosus TaxID=182803 RepID=A0A4Y2GP71_ARAVE|nr:hypothetical protein AVEN_64837-1 [Araneus ventricosus]